MTGQSLQYLKEQVKERLRTRIAPTQNQKLGINPFAYLVSSVDVNTTGSRS